MVKKAIIVLRQPGAEPLSLGRAVAPEFWLLDDRPLIEHLVDEVIEAGADEIFFVGPSGKKAVCDYFNQADSLEEVSGDLTRFVQCYRSKKFNFITENGKFGPALSKLITKVKDEPTALSWADDFWVEPEGVFVQLARVFNTSNQTVLGLTDKANDVELSLSLDKIADRIYRVKEAKNERQDRDKLFLSSRAIITSEFWKMFTDIKREVKEEKFDFNKVLSAMVAEGKPIYGYQLRGDQFDLNERSGWLAANRSLAQQDDE